MRLHSTVKSCATRADTQTVLASDLLPQTTELITGLGALVTGVASLVSAIVSSRVTRRRMTDECERRIAEVNRAFKAGLRLADQRPRVDPHGERWSHLE